jgi:hypothetical protein
MKILLDTCVWGKAKQELASKGHDVEWAGDWEADPGDTKILSLACESCQNKNAKRLIRSHWNGAKQERLRTKKGRRAHSAERAAPSAYRFARFAYRRQRQSDPGESPKTKVTA